MTVNSRAFLLTIASYEHEAAGAGFSWRDCRAKTVSPGDGLGMQNAIDLLMLVCATLAALAFGVLAAYGVCRGAFVIFRIHALQVAERTKPRIAPVSQP